MENKKSSTPMVLGIVGFVVNIPGLFCAAACGAATGVATEMAAIESGMESDGTAGAAVMGSVVLMTIIPMLIGFIASFMAKSKAVVAAWLMILSAIALFIITILSGNWVFGLVNTVCYLVGGILALGNR
ncbi:MAG: hypothetical protein N4A49_04075 [Marinifilaceae bacterium]|jgi:Kef-type K+ transport system membrane component KefB|nr:hypothetical protein [Marinifilaceae bacterium]